MRQAVILDPAHGKDTPGKRSPDGLHREYLWSRGRIATIVNNILNLTNLNFDLYYPFLHNEFEPGLTTRVVKYNGIAKDYEQTFMLSIHNDAFGNGETWQDPFGTSVWTSKGEDDSDPYATSLFNFIENKFPNEKLRPAYWLNEKEAVKDPDWEANFTVLAGNSQIDPNYDAVLLEWRFQTNKEDFKKLMNKTHNEHFEDMITEWILNTFNYDKLEGRAL
jgi:N-acetylmuramoyl-L-alanine amidase